MQISYDHLCKLFMSSYKYNIDEFWLNKIDEVRCNNAVSTLFFREHPKYLAALDMDIEVFCSNLPLDGQTPEVKGCLKRYWLSRG